MSEQTSWRPKDGVRVFVPPDTCYGSTGECADSGACMYACGAKESNQCDGCQQGAPLRGDLHIDKDDRAFMACQGRYAAGVKACRYTSEPGGACWREGKAVELCTCHDMTDEQVKAASAAHGVTVLDNQTFSSSPTADLQSPDDPAPDSIPRS